MSVFKSTDFIGGTALKCDSCGAEVMKWIHMLPGGDLCVNCAQAMMRRLFEDLIEYHNGRNADHVSLLNIMYHGDLHRSKVLNLPQVPMGSPFGRLNKEESMKSGKSIRTKERRSGNRSKESAAPAPRTVADVLMEGGAA